MFIFLLCQLWFVLTASPLNPLATAEAGCLLNARETVFFRMQYGHAHT
jgi:hypothetical protein